MIRRPDGFRSTEASSELPLVTISLIYNQRIIQGKAKNSFQRGVFAGDWLLLEVRGSGIMPVTSEDSGEPASGGS